MRKKKDEKDAEVPAAPEAKDPRPVAPEHDPKEGLTEVEKRDVQVIERVIESKEVTAHEAFGKLSRAQINLIKRTVAQGASDDELRLFIQVCKGANLNPFLRQAHFVPFWDSKAGEERRAIVIGIDGFRAIAESSGQYAGNDDPLYEGEEDVSVDVWEGKGKDRKVTGTQKIVVPKKATVTVHKIVGGARNPFTASARWSEYYPGGKKGGQWHSRPYLMLGKCAEALALRKAFPKLLSGMYEDAEFHQASAEAADQQRVASGFQKLMAAVETATPEELRSYLEKLSKSDKYTAAQKKQFTEAVEKRLQGEE